MCIRDRSNIPLAQDLALKRTVHAPLEQKPIYAWRDVVPAGAIQLPPIVLLCPHGEERFDIAEVADTLGKAFTNVCIAQGEKEIFTEKNRAWVAQICRELAANLSELARLQNPLRLTLDGLYELIEKTLVDNNAYICLLYTSHREGTELLRGPGNRVSEVILAQCSVRRRALTPGAARAESLRRRTPQSTLQRTFCAAPAGTTLHRPSEFSAIATILIIGT